ncbi:ABC transporter substrate-binding protein [Thermocrinis minervae]|uniref:ABC transporter substrate-binding protein n=1 Tax=Thermocrinis minervae TaxID=381751 RepID=UPI001E337EF8|nr:ABC transporter substrate-binding protein [Thermocrinis minervae]
MLGENIKKPIVVMGGTALKTWGITHEFKKPSYPITGVDNLNAELMEKRVELFSKLFPDVKKVVVFCTPRFEASKEATRRAIKAGQVHGIKVVPVSVDNANDLEYIISHMREDGFGGILLTPCFYTENFLQSYILYYASFYSIPVMCLSPDQVKQGCPVAYGTSQFEQGYQAAFIAYRIFSGEDVRNIPFEPVRNVKLAINFSAFRELGYYNNPYVFMLAQTVE